MVQILPPPKPYMPVAGPGSRMSVAPSPHSLFLDDYEYYDNLGRDPLQQNLVWGIEDDDERVQELKQVLESHPLPKQVHRRNLLAKAARRGDEAIVNYLISTGLRVQPDIEQEDNKSNEDGQDDGSDMDEQEDGSDEHDEYSIPDKDDPSLSPLHLAVMNGRLNIVKTFIQEADVQVDTRDEFGRTPLIVAAAGGHQDILSYLLEKGADPLARPGSGNETAEEYLGMYAGANALESAAAAKSLECVKILLDRIDSTTKTEKRTDEPRNIQITPLALQCAAGGKFDILKLFLERGGYPLADAGGKTKGQLLSDEQRLAIAEALSSPEGFSGDLESLKLLLSYQYPVNEQGKPTGVEIPEELHKPIIYGTYAAAQSGKVDKLQYLLSFGLKEHDGMSVDDLPEGQLINIQHLFETAVLDGAIDCAKFIMKSLGAKPDVHRVPSGVRPLYCAALQDKPDMVSFLLDHHADIHSGNGRFAAGPTALFGAIHMKSLPSIELLLKHGGPVDHVDDEIANIDKPTTAVLRTGGPETRYGIRLETEANVAKWLEEFRNDLMTLNPPYVLLHLGPEDRDWIGKLQQRRPDDELRESGPKARELNEEEKVKLQDLPEDDVRRMMVSIPISAKREKELDADDDLRPEWRPAFVPVTEDDE